MRQAAMHNKDVIMQPFVMGLGILMQKLLIVSEKDCMKIQPESRLDRWSSMRFITYCECRDSIVLPMARAAAG